MATLKSLVDETTNIKNELEVCYTNLKNNLIKKGVECDENDKILSLINKVNDIKGFKLIPGNTFSMPGFTPKTSETLTSINIVKDLQITMSGNLRLGLYCKTSTYYNTPLNAQIVVTVKRHNEIYYTKTIPLKITSTNGVGINFDEISFNNGDTVTISMGFTQSYNNQYMFQGSLTNISFDLKEF